MLLTITLMGLVRQCSTKCCFTISTTCHCCKMLLLMLQPGWLFCYLVEQQDRQHLLHGCGIDWTWLLLFFCAAHMMTMMQQCDCTGWFSFCTAEQCKGLGATSSVEWHCCCGWLTLSAVLHRLVCHLKHLSLLWYQLTACDDVVPLVDAPHWRKVVTQQRNAALQHAAMGPHRVLCCWARQRT